MSWLADDDRQKTTQALRDWLPQGGTLSDEAWRQRHRVIVILLGLHALGLAIYAIVAGYGIPHSLGEASIVAVAAVGAGATSFSRQVRSVIATLGLLAASALLVHVTNG